jgi:hypothetical protein
MGNSTENARGTKITNMVVVAFFLGILIGYFWGREIETPPYAVSLGHYNFIEVVQKRGGDVYKFGPKDGGGYKFITDISPSSDDYPYWANPEKSTRIIKKKIR